MSLEFKLKNTIKYPTSLIVNGANALGYEIAKALMEQGGYVIIVDVDGAGGPTKELEERFGSNALLSYIDQASIPHLDEDLRRLDYVFYLADDTRDLEAEISTQDFLKYSNYLDSILSTAVRFEAKFLLGTYIRAHHALMESRDMDINYGRDSAVSHSVYTEMEIQRYAESLTLEYVNKTGLDARIVRMGELIGEGIDLGKDTVFTKLVIDAVSNRDLVLMGDGLEEEWYVHMSDAAYGLIKAQFTKNTKGQVYSVCYEHSYSHLSVAYKLQELEPGASEIAFRQDEHRLPPLKLYKPAPNLNTIGWRPKVQFEAAVEESLTAAKLSILEALDSDGDAKTREEGGFMNKLLQMFSGGKEDGEEEDRHPVGKLIEERKKQQKLRDISVEKADEYLKYRKKLRPRTAGDKFRYALWQVFVTLKKPFKSLRYVTPGQFIVYLSLIGLFIIFYFGVFSPMVAIGRNLVIINSNVSLLRDAAKNYDLKQTSSAAAALETAFAENTELLGNYKGLARILSLDEELASIEEINELNHKLLSGISSVTYASEPLGDYFGRYSSNVRYRPSSENYLDTTSGTDFSVILSETVSRRAFADKGIEDLNVARNLLKQFDFNKLPDFLRNYLVEHNSLLLDISERAQSVADVSRYTTDLLGLENETTYLVVVLDNARPMPIGGAMSSFALLTLQNGSVSEAKVQSVSTIKTDLGNTPGYLLEEINARSFQNKNRRNLKLEDLALVGDVEIFSDAAKDIWGGTLSRQIDVVVLVNYSALGEWIDAVGGVEVEGVNFSADNMLDKFNSLQSGSTLSSIQKRNDLSSQLLAKSIDKSLSNYKENFFKVGEALSGSVANKDIMVLKNDLEINELANKYTMHGNLAQKSNFPVFTYLVADSQVSSPTKYLGYNQAVEIDVNKDSSLSYRMLLKLGSGNNVDEIAICIPISARSFGVIGIERLRVVKEKTDNLQCANVKLIAESEMVAEWTTLPFENSSSQRYNFALAHAKPSGVGLVSDIEIRLAEGLEFVKTFPQVVSSGGAMVFTNDLQNDQLINLTVEKK